MQLVMMSLVLGTVMVSTLPAQAGEQSQAATLKTDPAPAQTGINFSNSLLRNAATIPAKVLIVEDIAGKCMGGLFIPTSPSVYSFSDLRWSPASNNASPLNLNSGSPFKFSTTTPSTPGSTNTSEKPAAPSTTSQGSGFTIRPSTTEGELQASFVSGTTPPASGLRVRIANVTPGMEGAAPYSDREYNEGNRSERFMVRFGNRHDGAYLAVREGDNEFTYQIKRGDRTVESGKFKARVDRQVETVRRSISLEQKQLQCQLSAPLPKPLPPLPKINQEPFKLPTRSMPAPVLNPPTLPPIWQPRIQVPQLQIQPQFQPRPPILPSVPSPILTNSLFQR